MALIALCLQKRFDKRPDKTSHMLPASAVQPGGNHRAVWLGGGGVGKTWTLQKVVEPLAVTFFGNNGYAAAAQSNHAAQNLGARGRTLHSANGLLMTDSLQTARLCLSEKTRKKLDRLTGEIGVDVIDELGCVPGDLLHADALRRTYGRALRYNIDPTAYLKPQETWGRVPCKILSGDFLQLPPVPASASLWAGSGRMSATLREQRRCWLRWAGAGATPEPSGTRRWLARRRPRRSLPPWAAAPVTRAKRWLAELVDRATACLQFGLDERDFPNGNGNSLVKPPRMWKSP